LRRAAPLVAALFAAALPGCGDDDGRRPDRRPAAQPAVGITEPNPALVWAPDARPGVPEPFARRRTELAGLRPRHYRLLVDWSQVQPRPDAAPNWDVPQRGCDPAGPPCAPYRGVREQLRAVRSRQHEQGGWEVVVVLLYAPPWATRAPSGCEPGRVDPHARMLRPGALGAYRALVRSLAALARAEGVEIPRWAAWNEPNYRGFVSPQRLRCDPGAASASSDYYAGLARTLKAELDSVPGDQRLILGETSDNGTPTVKGSTAEEFVRGLPRDVACASDLWAHHVYVGDPYNLPRVQRALESHRCGFRHGIWITETGVGGDPPGTRRPTERAALRAQCRAQQALLVRFASDSRVRAAFQYTFREATTFPVGLVDPRLSRAYPTLGVWRAWGAREGAAPRPVLPAECS
jgi:hypothetical protein